MVQELTGWLELAVRWLHIIAGIAWIGASFYFVFLNNHLESPGPEEDDNVGGTLWAIHGGGFYHVRMFKVAPGKLPETLHWFKWEAYTTWISGFSLLVLLYYVGAKSYLVDPTVADIEVWQAICLGLAAIVSAWLVYDILCRTPLVNRPVVFFIAMLLFFAAAEWVLKRYFNFRAAYIHMCAMIGTIMAANVFRVIIPSQKELVNAMVENRQPDAALAKKAKLRSLHNNYFTLPVLFIMISHHYPFTFAHEYNWLILVAISLIGVAIRHWFNLRGQGRRNVYIMPLAALAMVSLAFVSSWQRHHKPVPQKKVAFSEVQEIIKNRCISCHSANPTDDIFKAAPLGVMYDTPLQIKSMAPKILDRVVLSKNMPLGNKTQMKESERLVIAAWIAQGADTRQPEEKANKEN